ncbi:uncharacterized protein L969DRAFT_92651 [Mixia osmundae IAM 14324]|uniref:Ammonium-dependent carbamoyl phosphate synthetase n=1 Tax=Mixia osmundae (strain CBS 9802 / IAM 14324 / JCM 22182 / KY 12970) TaxID=764103 RepID=G7DY59_MIXOS|nr:uncharacterized protein L969DRAFT_92651 [Mixia osmundae IAM 14324]KEI41421.1 hypothetical protein L969DRAFT_92651 [Mixia osmundae IAM 14324]GAA95519.1 hypothetical protein E5Q_02174 [Mixia osmundae IAM 14324]
MAAKAEQAAIIADGDASLIRQNEHSMTNGGDVSSESVLPVTPSVDLSRSVSLSGAASPVARRAHHVSQALRGPSEPVTSPHPSVWLEAGISESGFREKDRMVLELEDGSAYEGVSFGATGKSISGECVFATGMVGYPESLTDPSYSGQILVITYPLVGSYGVPPRQSDLNSARLPAYFESSRIHVAGLVVGSYSGEGSDFSHHLASSELATWLKEQGVPALYGIDTRDLTKKLREKGTFLGKVLARNPAAPALPARASRAFPSNRPSAQRSWRAAYLDCPLEDHNARNLVAQVSRRSPQVYSPGNFDGIPKAPAPLLHPSGRPLRVIALDVGMKYNQIRCFVLRGIELKCVPWDYDFNSPNEEPFDGLFISNGPGDPVTVSATIDRIRVAVEKKDKPIFGICLGHQLLALAAGASTVKLKYGNRGQNIPCTDMLSGRCYITSQNHGYAVDASTLKSGWKELFVNANDGSNEGIFATDLPYFSVQFHPESTPGPRDTEFLFDVFIDNVKACADAGKLVMPVIPGGIAAENAKANPRVHVRKVLVLGSGGLSIGQAGEFDYSGSQCIKALREEGIYTVLINANIASTQSNITGLADKVFFLPVTPDFVRKVIEHERPDGIYVTFGGQTALNVGIKLKDEFAKLGVKVLGTPIDTIITTEDREMFANAMLQINEKCAESASAVNVEEAVAAARKIGYPVIVRAAFALGGLGSGFANNEGELLELLSKAFATSPQVLVEKSMKGWKEIEYEVVRDCRNNCITVCNMENFDPLGIHTGDSIVVAPSQTLSDADYNMLRTTAVNVIRHLGVVGECNIQYALNPESQEYCIIEVNARLSRSSALASKATGYPLAFIAAKLGLGIPLNEIKNSVTLKTSACFEPSLDYLVVKIPRWDLKKFTRVSTALSSSMKSVGEVMAIGRTFEETIQKAIRSIDPSFAGFCLNDHTDSLDEELMNPSDKRLFAIANAMHKGYSVQKIWELTRIDKWFLNKLQHIVDLERIFSRHTPSSIPTGMVRHAKQLGFSDRQLARAIGSNELAVRRLRQEYGVIPVVKQIDTVAAEFPAFTNYLYMTYNGLEDDVTFDDQGIMVLGSGVYRIGSSVEFDWCAVQAIRTIRKRGFKTVMVNYNPETVSTDYDEADRLYFENISVETVMDIYEAERSSGVIISMGGQTSNNIALPLHRQNVKILGTSPEMIDNAENRYKFSRMLDQIGVDQPLWKELAEMEDAHAFCNKVGYPVLVRPSYVLSGAAMNVVYSSDDLSNYLTQATAVSREHPVVISKYIEEAKEIEMDAVARNGKMVMHYISEHVENAGIHSGDATLVLPPQDLDPETVRRIEIATQKIGNALNVTGPFNIQFLAKDNEIKVIECNVRAARSFPFVSKVTGVDAIEMATDVMLGLSVQAYPALDLPPDYVGVKVPQFSFSRLAGADPILGVEMASTGEVACFGKDRYEAYLKALLASGISLPNRNILLSIGSYKEKMELLPSVQKLHRLGFNIFATAGTADFIQEHGIPVKYLEALGDEDQAHAQKSEYSLTQHIADNLIDFFISIPSKNRYRRPASYMSKGYRSRRMAVDFAVPLLTNVKCAKLFVEALARKPTLQISTVDYKTAVPTVMLPGLVDLHAFIPRLAAEDCTAVEEVTRAAISGGFTAIQFVPTGSANNLEDEMSLDTARANASGASHCDYAFAVVATPRNSMRLVSEVIDGTKSLYVPFTGLNDPKVNKVAAVVSHFGAWPAEKPIITDAKSTDLASILLLASLHGRSIHVADVTSADDISLIALSKQKDLKVTCDVSIHALFFASEDLPGTTCLPTKADQAVLWENLELIDAFSVGATPYLLAKQMSKSFSAASAVEDAIHLLLWAVSQGRLTLEQITSRLSTNPRAIFDLSPQQDSYVEFEIGGRSRGLRSETWSPLAEDQITGSVHRVVLRGRTVYLDGNAMSKTPLGRDLADDIAPAVISRRKSTRFSMNQLRPSLFGVGDSTKLATGMPLSAGLLKSPTQALPPTSITRSPKVSGPESMISAVVSSAPPQPTASSTFLHSLQTTTPALSSLAPIAAFSRRHILSVKQFTRQDLHSLFTVATEMRIQVERNQAIDILRGRVLCTLFYEPSTRTSASFEAAMNRLGGKVVAVTADRSSVTKGESLADTVRTLGSYGDAIVLRHPEPGSTSLAAKFSPVPIISAGDGIGEHPTQAMLDVYTIREELGTVNGLTVTMVGDLKNGRTVHSLVKLLSLYQVTFSFVAPPSLPMPESVKAEARRQNLRFTETTNLDSVIGSTDVLYVTRVQQERFANQSEYEAVKDAYVVNNDVMSRAKTHMIVMHPLPRNNEIDPEVDYDSRAAYIRQMRYGLFVRMALLSQVLGNA